MSFLNASTIVQTKTLLAPHITRAQVIAFLHNNAKMHDLNPIIRSYKLLPAESSTAFFDSVPAENKPPATGPEPENGIPVYSVVEGSAASTEESGSTWRGGWAKRFIPDEIHYETSMQNTEDGMITITHAPLGVNSVTKWFVTEAEDDPGRLVIQKKGVVTSNRMLMTFIKTTIQGSYDKLAVDFVAALEKEVAGGSAVKEEVVEGEAKVVETTA